jgi:hypothetical protein
MGEGSIAGYCAVIPRKGMHDNTPDVAVARTPPPAGVK